MVFVGITLPREIQSIKRAVWIEEIEAHGSPLISSNLPQNDKNQMNASC
jgi:hypothetical protein